MRVFGRTWKDKQDDKGPIMVHTQMVCPDKECQKIVDAQFEAAREKRVASENRKIGIKLKKPEEVKNS